MADLYSELGKLKRELADLKPKAARSEEMRMAKEKAEAEAKEWNKVCHEALAEKQSMAKALAEEKHSKAELKKILENMNREVEAARKKLERAKIDAKFDKQAREGQVKRSRVLTHELEETREANVKLEYKNNELEEKVEDLTRAVNHERALRLQDLHRNMASHGNRKLAEQREREMEDAAAAITDNLNMSEQRNRSLQRRLKASDKIAEAHETEMLVARTELEDEKKKANKLLGELSSMQDTLSKSLLRSKRLEAEVSRLRRTVTLGALTHGERAEALIGTKRMTSLSEDYAELGDSGPPPTAALDSASLSQATQDFRAQTSSGGRRRRPRERQSDTNLLESQTDPSWTQRAHTAGPGFNSLRQRAEPMRGPEAPHSSLPASPSHTSLPAPQPRHSHRERPRPGTSSLLHSGSLYLGHGLGIRKAAPTKSTHTGSTKHMLKEILAKTDL